MVCTFPKMPCVLFSAMCWDLEIRQVVDKIAEQVRKCALTQDAKFRQTQCYSNKNIHIKS